MHDRDNLLLEHLVSIVELVTQELKETKKEISGNDKDIALINLRLHAAEKLVKDIKAYQDASKVVTAEAKGAGTVKWTIITLIGTSSLAFIIKEIFNNIYPSGG